MKKTLKSQYIDKLISNLSEAMTEPKFSELRGTLKGKILNSP